MSGEAVLKRRPFLTARWSNLFLANFSVPDRLLTPRLPNGLVLDRYQGSAYVSLVAFDFQDTRVLGIAWPGYRTFSEINLRFYVRHGEERGVVFVREFVPLRLVARLARWLYNEPYECRPMTSAVHDSTQSLTIEHDISTSTRRHTLRAVGAKPAIQAGPDTVEHFFKEHRWGFGRTRRRVTLRYEVCHPVWETCPVQEAKIDFDWVELHGPEWSVLEGRKPDSTVIALGSEVSVYPHGSLSPRRE